MRVKLIIILTIVLSLVGVRVGAQCTSGTDMSYEFSGAMSGTPDLINTKISYASPTCSMSGGIHVWQAAAGQIGYEVTKGNPRGDSYTHIHIAIDGTQILDYDFASPGTGYGTTITINPGAHTITAWMDNTYYHVKSEVLTTTTSSYTTGSTIHQAAYANKSGTATLFISAGYGAGQYALEAYDSASGWIGIGEIAHTGSPKSITISNSTGSWTDGAGTTGTSSAINACHMLYRWRKLTGDSFVGYTDIATMPYTLYDFGASSALGTANNIDLTTGTTGLSSSNPSETTIIVNNSPTTLVNNSDGTSSYQDTIKNGQSTTDAVGTDTTEMDALNKQTGINTAQLSVLDDIRDDTDKMAKDVSNIADKSSSTGGSGGLTADQSEDLSQIADDVHSMRQNDDTWAQLTDVADTDGKQAALIADRKSDIDSVADAAGSSIKNAFEGAGLGGSLSNPGVSTATGSDSIWIVTIGGITVDLSPDTASPSLMTWLAIVRNVIAWLVLGYFYSWYVDTVKERITALILVPTPVANTNPQGIAGAVTNMTKIAVWVVLIMTLPALFAAIPTAVDSISNGGMSLWDWVTGSAFTSSGGGGDAASFAWYWLQRVFPITVMVNCFILRVTATLYMGVIVGFSFWVVKQSTAY